MVGDDVDFGRLVEPEALVARVGGRDGPEVGFSPLLQLVLAAESGHGHVPFADLLRARRVVLALSVLVGVDVARDGVGLVHEVPGQEVLAAAPAIDRPGQLLLLEGDRLRVGEHLARVGAGPAVLHVVGRLAPLVRHVERVPQVRDHVDVVGLGHGQKLVELPGDVLVVDARRPLEVEPVAAVEVAVLGVHLDQERVLPVGLHVFQKGLEHRLGVHLLVEEPEGLVVADHEEGRAVLVLQVASVRRHPDPAVAGLGGDGFGRLGRGGRRGPRHQDRQGQGGGQETTHATSGLLAWFRPFLPGVCQNMRSSYPHPCG
ncbi:hypothetical protein D3C72_907720 [compost metagenome]